MNYKIVSTNQKLHTRVTPILNSLDMKESIHIQEVDLWLVDVKTMDKEALTSYKNRINFSNILFIVNNSHEIKLCLDNCFTNYINISFTDEELISWCKYFFKNKKQKIVKLDDITSINLEESVILQNSKTINLTSQEKKLINELFSFNFVPTNQLANALNVQSLTSVRTVINRIKKKLEQDIFEQKKTFGYRLKKTTIKKESENKNSSTKELEEQNQLLQNIIDSSPIFIVTFIHKQLYCINKSFRDYLGNETIKELWDEEKGEFFELIEDKLNTKEELKQILFTKGKHQVKLYETNKNSVSFEVETLYFENLDKHLLVFKPKNF